MGTPVRTPMRAFRVPDELWGAAKAVAAARGESLSEVIRRALADYVAAANATRQSPPKPRRPSGGT